MPITNHIHFVVPVSTVGYDRGKGGSDEDSHEFPTRVKMILIANDYVMVILTSAPWHVNKLWNVPSVSIIQTQFKHT